MPRQSSNTCPTMDAASVSLDYVHATACLGQPTWNGTAAGTCTIKNGDVWLTGGSGQRIAAAVKIDGPIVCNDVFAGATSMRSAGVWHEAVSEVARLDGGTLTECS
jgi:hypothetical protein